MSNSTPKVAVILLNWNGGEFTIPCLASLSQSTYYIDYIFVVDNASSDGSPERIIEQYPDVILIRNDANLGFAEGNNIGVRRAIEMGADYIWILNNDTIVADNCLQILIEATEANPQVAGISAKIYYDVPPNCLWYNGAKRHKFYGVAKHIDQGLQDLKFNETDVVETDFISGCCIFMPAWAYHKYGLFCPEFIAYHEDNDWCWRVTNANGKLLCAKGAKIWHCVSASMKKNTGKKNDPGISAFGYYLMIRNQIWTVRRNVRKPWRMILLCLQVFVAIKICVVQIINRTPLKIASILKGVRDGLTKKAAPFVNRSPL